MNVTKCLNGHFYDADKYQVCPHCGAVSIAGAPPKTEQAEKKPHGLFKKKKDTSQDIDMIRMPEKTYGKTFGVFNAEPAEDKPSEANAPSENSPAPVPAQPDFDGPVYIFGKTTQDKAQPLFSGTDESAADTPPAPATPSLQDAVKQVSSSSGGKTVGFFSTGAAESVSEPVVGWLVCIKGVHFGESFPISAGRNSVGRSVSNKIVFEKDPSVSREKHAWITYEPKKREFYIQPGEGSGLSYLNGDSVLESKKLAGRDKLEFGNGSYLLIPLCGDDFTWEDYMDKEQQK